MQTSVLNILFAFSHCRLATLHGMDRALMESRPALVGEIAYTARMANVFLPEGEHAKTRHDPIGAGIHVSGPDFHVSGRKIGNVLILFCGTRKDIIVIDNWFEAGREKPLWIMNRWEEFKGSFRKMHN